MHLVLVQLHLNQYQIIQVLIRTQSLDGINDQSFTINNLANIRIDQVSDSNGNIPLDAFKTKINVPPPGDTNIWNCKNKCI